MRLLIFGGTTEGRELAERLGKQEKRIQVTVSVATPLGAEELKGVSGIRVLTGRRTEAGMEELLRDFDLCVDATHPYAREATANIRGACRMAGIPCLRLLRRASSVSDAVVVSSCREAALFLEEQEGNVLLTTGAKELSAFAGLPSDRVYARVLPACESIRACEEIGLSHSHILALQGPFSQKLNEAMLEQYRIRWMVTKDGGAAGGFGEKQAAASRTGVRLVLIRRPEEEGESMEEIYRKIRSWETRADRRTVNDTVTEEPDVSAREVSPCR